MSASERIREGGRGVRYLLLLLALATLALPAKADPPLRHVETEIEKIIGRQVAFALRESSGIDTDPLLVNWVRKVGGDVAKQSFRTDLKIDFNIAGTDAANALAAPGGHIFVTRGLLDAIDSDDELASVLAHETGHVAKRHAMQQIEGNVLFLALVSAIPGRRNGNWRNALTFYNLARTLDKSREMEAQADEVGIVFADEAGYDPNGLVRFLDGFDFTRRNALEEWFATHPAPAKRVAAARSNPRVRRADPAERERVARGFEARGLPEAARLAREGRDPLLLPPLPPVNVPAFLAADRQQVIDRSEKVRKALSRPYQASRVGNTLQNLLLINNQPGDLRWVYLAARAYGVQTRVEDLSARTLRVARTAPGTFEALSAYAERPAGDPAALESSLGRGEVVRAVARLQGAPTPIGRAARAVDFVLLDLNNRFLRLNGTATWVRYLALEAILRYAESELSRADRMSGEAWRLLSLARIRRYQQRLNELVPEDDAARRALWYDLTQRRFGAAFPNAGPTGDATVRAALAIELGASASEVEKDRGERTWADWTLRKRGIPENVATAMRLLTLDLEREVAAAQQRQRQDGAVGAG